jgi:hypothetical protein
MAGPDMSLIDIWAKSKGPGKCRSCGAVITWAEVVKSGKRMPFDGEIVSVKTSHHPETAEPIETVDTTITKSHFASCTEPDKWRKKR